MPIIEIDGVGRVEVGDEFTALPPDQQNATVQEIAASFKPKAAPAEPNDHGLAERQKMSLVEKALSPLTSYPETYSRMNLESRNLMSQGVDQIKNANGALETAKGVGNTAIGAAGYLSSPLSAAYRTVVGQPIEDVTGIPREYTEFAAQLATPGVGLVGATRQAAPIKGVATRLVESKTPTAAELKSAASAGYESPAVKSLEVRPQALADFATGLKSRINEMGLDETLAPKTFTILGNVEKVPAEAMMTGQNLRTLQKTLGRASMAADPQERLAATKALIELNKHLENLPSADVLKGNAEEFSSAVSQANKNYSAAKTSEGLNKKMVSAQLRADSSNSGMNVANAIRQNLRQIITNEKQSRGMRPDELAAAENIVRGSRAENVVRGAGNILGGGGGLHSMVAAAAGGAAGGVAAGGVGSVIGATLPLAGYTLKAISNRMTVSKAQKLEEAIRARAPLASSMQKYEEAATAFNSDRSARTMAGAAIAARNLSHNLRASGFNVSPSELMKSLSAPGVGTAQDENNIPGRE